MRVLLDESTPRRLKNELAGHEVATVTDQGWQSKKNGDLLTVASPAGRRCRGLQIDCGISCDPHCALGRRPRCPYTGRP